MTRIISVPFRRPGSDCLLTEPWQLSVGSKSDELPAFIPHWDANVNISLARSVVVDVDDARRACGLGEGDPLRVLAVWRSSGTALRGAGTIVDLPRGGLQVAVLQLDVNGVDLAGEVEVGTQLVLARESTAPPPAPRIPGSVLWEETVQVALEGTSSRFPVEVADFDRASWLPSGAAWRLSWNGQDLEEPLLRGLQLIINSRHTAVVEAVQTPYPTTEQQAIRSTIYYDVGRSLIRGVLANDDFVRESVAYPEGSIGRAAHRLIRSLFPGDSNVGLRATLMERPDQFDSMLQAAFRLFLP